MEFFLVHLTYYTLDVTNAPWKFSPRVKITYTLNGNLGSDVKVILKVTLVPALDKKYSMKIGPYSVFSYMADAEMSSLPAFRVYNKPTWVWCDGPQTKNAKRRPDVTLSSFLSLDPARTTTT